MSAKRFSRENWLSLGLRRLSEAGPSALTLEALCAAAEKTRGSFYHHFADHGVYLRAMLEHWRAQSTVAVIDETNRARGSADRLNKLNELSLALDEKAELGVRRLAGGQAELAEVVAAVDRDRVAYLASLYAAYAGLTNERAERLAEVEYAAFIGHMLIWPGASPARRSAAARTFSELVKQAYGVRGAGRGDRE